MKGIVEQTKIILEFLEFPRISVQTCDPRKKWKRNFDNWKLKSGEDRSNDDYFSIDTIFSKQLELLSSLVLIISIGKVDVEKKKVDHYSVQLTSNC